MAPLAPIQAFAAQRAAAAFKRCHIDAERAQEAVPAVRRSHPAVAERQVTAGAKRVVEHVAGWSGRLAYDPGAVRAATLIVRGAWDRLCTDADAGWLAGGLGGAERRHVEIPRATHLMHLERGRAGLFTKCEVRSPKTRHSGWQQRPEAREGREDESEQREREAREAKSECTRAARIGADAAPETRLEHGTERSRVRNQADAGMRNGDQEQPTAYPPSHDLSSVLSCRAVPRREYRARCAVPYSHEMKQARGFLAGMRERLGRAGVLVLLGIAFAVSQATILTLLHPVGGAAVFRFQTTLSAADFAATLERWRAAGVLDAYWRHYALDFIHPVLYASFVAALLARGLDANRISHRYDTVLLAPLVAGTFDLVENAIHVALLADPARIGPLPVVASGVAAILKWTLLAASLVTAAALALRARRHLHPALR